MSGSKKSLLLLAATALTSFATSLTFTSAQNPNDIPGGIPFEVFSATLTQPTAASNGLWELQIDMNYYQSEEAGGGVTGNVFNPFTYGNFTYSPGDFLIQQTVGTVVTDYGIPLSGDSTSNPQVYAHPDPVTGLPDSTYLPGNLYAVGGTGSFQVGEGFLTSGPTLGNNAGSIFTVPGETPDPGFYTWLAAGGTQVGTGGLTIQQTGSGSDYVTLAVTDFFSAPTTFLPSDATFTVDFTSAICGNGTLTGSGPFPPTPPPSSVPEPGTFTLSASALVLLGFAAFRRRSRSF